LKKYDHVSLHCLQLIWLPVSHQIMFKSSYAMYRYYHHDHQPCLSFVPPILFGAHHRYNTYCEDSFANLLFCHLSTTKKYFCSSASSWWNVLTATIPVDCTYGKFVLSARNFYHKMLLQRVLYFVCLCIVLCCMVLCYCMVAVCMLAPVGKNGSADYCEGKLKINQSIN